MRDHDEASLTHLPTHNWQGIERVLIRVSNWELPWSVPQLPPGEASDFVQAEVAQKIQRKPYTLCDAAVSGAQRRLDLEIFQVMA